MKKEMIEIEVKDGELGRIFAEATMEQIARMEKVLKENGEKMSMDTKLGLILFGKELLVRVEDKLYELHKKGDEDDDDEELGDLLCRLLS